MTPEKHADQMADSGHILDADPDSTQRRVLRAVAHVTAPLHAEVERLRERVAALEKAANPEPKAAAKKES